MKRKFLLTIIAVLFIAISSVCSLGSVAANTKDEYTEERKESHGRYWWAKESFTVYNRKGVIKDVVTSSDTSADQR